MCGEEPLHVRGRAQHPPNGGQGPLTAKGWLGSRNAREYRAAKKRGGRPSGNVFLGQAAERKMFRVRGVVVGGLGGSEFSPLV